MSEFTTNREFFPTASNGDHLFAVREGVPLNDAFDQLTALLCSAESVLSTAATEQQPQDEYTALTWSGVYLLRFAAALVESMHSGHMAAIQGCRNE